MGDQFASLPPSPGATRSRPEATQNTVRSPSHSSHEEAAAMPPTADVAVPQDITTPPFTKSTIATTSIQLQEDSSLLTIDSLLRSRATSHPDVQVVSYPSAITGEYVPYTFRDLDIYAYRVAKHLQSAGLPFRQSSTESRHVIAMLGPSNLEYMITLLALMKLGHTILFLSTRIPAPAIESLIKETKCANLIADHRFLAHAAQVKTTLSTAESSEQLAIFNMPTRSCFEFPITAVGDTRLDVHLQEQLENAMIGYIIHSSGSTGNPKAIYQGQKAALSNFSNNMNMKAFITLPLYHNHGICNLYRAFWSKKPISMYNADLPLTSEHLVKVLREHKFEIFYGVPYALKLLAETPEGLGLLAEFKVVMYGGSACPDDLGDVLVQNGVNLISHYGATEVGQLMTSQRPLGDLGWNYVRETPRLSPFLRWIPQGPGLYECCVLPGWPAKTTSNQPDGSYRTKDLFEKHRTLPQAWKYICRQDDTLVLVNGEKFNPLTTEGRIKSSKLVTEAVIFGAQQPYLGVLIVPSPETQDKTPAQVLDLIWPVIQSSQRDDDAFAKLSREMIVILPHGIDYPRTDKGSVIRQAFYRDFSSQIELAYKLSLSTSEDAKTMTEPQIRHFIRDLILKSTQQTKGSTATATVEFSDDSDFFALGLDSLQSIQIRAEILRNIKTSAKLTQNVVFDHSTVNKLSAYLAGTELNELSIEDQMRQLTAKYADMSTTQPAPLPLGTSVLVTGSTGSLGAHIVSILARNPEVERIYCLNRASDEESAQRRTVDSMELRKCYASIPLTAQRKIIALPADLSRQDLGLSEKMYKEVAEGLRSVIHSAWAVNFQLGLSSFEKDNIAGVRNLITLCQQSGGSSGDGQRTRKASFNFCSSISATVRHPDENGPVPEKEPQPEWAQGMGYAQSKSVAEALCARAGEQFAGDGVDGVKVKVLRIGQIVADTKNGIWNATEAVPLMIQSGSTIGALPRLGETPAWLPVDVTAQGVVDASLCEDKEKVGGTTGTTYANIVNHRSFSWTQDLLPALRKAGLDFEEVSAKEWVQRLRDSNPDPVENPPIKLVDFFASKYDKEESELGIGSKKFDTVVARGLSEALENAPVLDEEFVKLFINQFQQGAWRTSKAAEKK